MLANAVDSPTESLDQYFTGGPIAQAMIEWALLTRGMRVLEPSAGDGGLVRHLPKNIQLRAVEYDERLIPGLKAIGHPSLTVEHADFLRREANRDAYDVAVMNPPYGEGRDGDHVAHALRSAKRVVALVRANFEFGIGRYHQLFRWAEVTRRVVLVRRPTFYGPGDKGMKARHDYELIELVRRGGDRISDDLTTDRVETEYWTGQF